MLGQGLAGLFTQAIDEVPDALRQSRLFGDLNQQTRGQRREFGRLVNDRAARRQSRRDLPGRQHERRVPGRDDADGPDRRARRHVDLTRRAQAAAVARFGRAVSEEPEVLRAAQRGLLHELQRLPGVHALDEGDLFGARHDGVCDLV